MLITAKWMKRLANRFPSGKVAIDVSELGITIIVSHVLDSGKIVKFSERYSYTQTNLMDTDNLISLFVGAFERYERNYRRSSNG